MRGIRGEPFWTVGDFLTYKPGSGVCIKAIFAAEHEPRFEDGQWLYGYRPAEQLRLATAEDFTRAIQIAAADVGRASHVLGQLIDKQKRFQERASNGASS